MPLSPPRNAVLAICVVYLRSDRQSPRAQRPGQRPQQPHRRRPRWQPRASSLVRQDSWPMQLIDTHHHLVSCRSTSARSGVVGSSPKRKAREPAFGRKGGPATTRGSRLTFTSARVSRGWFRGWSCPASSCGTRRVGARSRCFHPSRSGMAGSSDVGRGAEVRDALARCALACECRTGIPRRCS